MRFATTMHQQGNNTGIEVPPDLMAQLGGGKRPPVVVTVNGFTYRTTVGVMGGRYLLPFSADKRAATGLRGGDALTVDIDLDSEPRTVELPPDLRDALDAAGLRGAFDELAPSRQKAHITSVEGAKAAETRARRVRAVVAALTA